MSRYDALTRELAGREEPEVTLSFDELDEIVGGLPKSAKTYHAWWANKRSSQAHARAWLDAGRVASPDFRARQTNFRLLSSDAEEMFGSGETADGQEAVDTYVESTISLERDLEDYLVANLEALEEGLALVGSQITVDVGRVDILGRTKEGEKVIVELKVGQAKDSAVGQVARYMGWYARSDGERPRAILVAASFPDAVKYAAAAIPGLRLVTYRVSFDFSDEGLKEAVGE